MASITREITIDAPPDEVWAVISDFGGGPARMAPGFVAESHATGPDTRTVTFVSGTVVHERLITVDHAARRFVYAVYDGTVPLLHDNAVMQVLPAEGGGTRFVWSRDLLPDSLAGPFAASMETGSETFRQAMGPA
ncbi:SRPBCC family protein [Nocardia aurantia]|uniref:SRPBCC family protein n=1 Tax=Nocardia aurantia TaxID=2585199 RepID=A0A7K0DMG2_9NOCA|nr:SRPBCC family protein [Nocardia aurantia]MQY26502.1 hypothetical protein [Nocardia aurantia]